MHYCYDGIVYFDMSVLFEGDVADVGKSKYSDYISYEDFCAERAEWPVHLVSK